MKNNYMTRRHAATGGDNWFFTAAPNMRAYAQCVGGHIFKQLLVIMLPDAWSTEHKTLDEAI